MTEEQWMSVVNRDMFTCQCCGKTPGMTGLQVAHRMHQGKQTENYIIGVLTSEYNVDKSRAWIRRNVIDHPDNLKTACCSKCNDSFNLLFKPIECKKLLDSILSQVL